MEQLGRSKCDYMSTIDLRDAFHTQLLAKTSKSIVELHHIMDHSHTIIYVWEWE